MHVHFRKIVNLVFKHRTWIIVLEKLKSSFITHLIDTYINVTDPFSGLLQKINFFR